MKCKAIKHYTDKLTGKSIWAGDLVELADDRAKTLIKGGFVEEVKEKKEKNDGK